MSDWCDTCRTFHSNGQHYPLFEIAVEHDGDDDDFHRKIRACDAEEAAEKWAAHEDSWSAEYLIVSGRDEPTIKVRDEAGNVSRFKVTGEWVPQYTAEKLP